jgi:hypothetical protein
MRQRVDKDRHGWKGRLERFNSSHQFLTFHLEDPLLDRLSAGLAVHVHLQYHGDHRWLQIKAGPLMNYVHTVQLNHCNVVVSGVQCQCTGTKITLKISSPYSHLLLLFGFGRLGLLLLLLLR